MRVTDLIRFRLLRQTSISSLCEKWYFGSFCHKGQNFCWKVTVFLCNWKVNEFWHCLIIYMVKRLEDYVNIELFYSTTDHTLREVIMIITNLLAPEKGSMMQHDGKMPSGNTEDKCKSKKK